MASVPVVMQRIRRARRECNQPPSRGRFRKYETEYRHVFESLEELGGEECLDEVADWTLEWTRNMERLPTPKAVRRQARRVCDDRNLEIPPESALSG